MRPHIWKHEVIVRAEPPRRLDKWRCAECGVRGGNLVKDDGVTPRPPVPYVYGSLDRHWREQLDDCDFTLAHMVMHE